MFSNSLPDGFFIEWLFGFERATKREEVWYGFQLEFAVGSEKLNRISSFEAEMPTDIDRDGDLAFGGNSSDLHK